MLNISKNTLHNILELWEFAELAQRNGGTEKSTYNKNNNNVCDHNVTKQNAQFVFQLYKMGMLAQNESVLYLCKNKMYIH